MLKPVSGQLCQFRGRAAPFQFLQVVDTGMNTRSSLRSTVFRFGSGVSVAVASGSDFVEKQNDGEIMIFPK